MTGRGRELTPHGARRPAGGADFDHEILDPEAAAEIIIDRLRDAGFEIVPARRGGRAACGRDRGHQAEIAGNVMIKAQTGRAQS
jgi:hypothetical protein